MFKECSVSISKGLLIKDSQKFLPSGKNGKVMSEFLDTANVASLCSIKIFESLTTLFKKSEKNITKEFLCIVFTGLSGQPYFMFWLFFLL